MLTNTTNRGDSAVSEHTSPESPVILQMVGIDKRFQGVHALKQCHLELRRGEIHALVGENGAGKSTLMKVLTGIYKADEGKIIYNGKEVQFKNPKEAQEAGISIVHQELNLMGSLTVAENIFLGRKAATKEEAIRFAGEQLVKGGYVEPEYVQAMLDREKLTPTYLGESIAVPHGTVEAKDRVLKTGVVFCQYPEGVRFGEEEDDIARLVIGIAARNNEHIQVITSLTNALDDESVIERLAHTTSVDEVLELLAGRK